MNHHLVPIEITSTFEYSIERISTLYKAVFDEKQPATFFLSNVWISNWLACAEVKPELVTFSAQDEVIGFVFIGHQKTSLGQVFYLNQTGNDQDDQIWIEFNDVICNKHHQSCRTALLKFIEDKPNSFQFVGINTLVEDWGKENWLNWSIEPINGFSVQLNNDASSDAHFSKNTRSQISRSRTFIEKEYGEIEINWLDATHIEGAIADIASMHIVQWGKHEYGSGFNNKKFVNFHERVLQQGINQFSHIAKFTAGKHRLGYLYYFTQGKKVYFYLSAINYQNKNNKYKPGLVMHKMALAHFKALGYDEYDFLAGQARYKTSLSNHNYLLFSVKLYMNKWYYWPVKKLVDVKRWLYQMSSRNNQ